MATAPAGQIAPHDKQGFRLRFERAGQPWDGTAAQSRHRARSADISEQPTEPASAPARDSESEPLPAAGWFLVRPLSSCPCVSTRRTHCRASAITAARLRPIPRLEGNQLRGHHENDRVVQSQSLGRCDDPRRLVEAPGPPQHQHRPCRRQRGPLWIHAPGNRPRLPVAAQASRLLRAAGTPATAPVNSPAAAALAAPLLQPVRRDQRVHAPPTRRGHPATRPASRTARRLHRPTQQTRRRASREKVHMPTNHHRQALDIFRHRPIHVTRFGS